MAGVGFGVRFDFAGLGFEADEGVGLEAVVCELEMDEADTNPMETKLGAREVDKGKEKKVSLKTREEATGEEGRGKERVLTLERRTLRDSTRVRAPGPWEHR